MTTIRLLASLPAAALAITAAAGVAVVAASAPADQEVPPVRFSLQEAGGRRPTAWSLFHFPSVERRTDYRLHRPTGGRPVLHADSRRAAALLWSPVADDLTDCSRLSWSWKVDRTIAGSDLETPRLDDAAARVYVGFAYRPDLVGAWQRFRYRLAAVHYGETPPFAAMVYTWAHREEVGSRFASPSLDRAITVVVRNADDPIGEWVEESRDVRADFRAWFGFDPPPLSHVAVMTDTDDTHSEATAWYGDLVLE